jgi:uncharacterized membrane protein YgaE (UPF0421/DUF939 family)
VKWGDVSGKWTITAHGEYSKSLTVDLTAETLTACRVGGVVSETSFKFFIQFVFYTTCYCIFTLVVTAVFTAELQRTVSFIHF